MARTIRVVAAIISSDGRYLITQRRETAVLPLLWEFPGGRVELGERDEEALRRELRERLDANIEVIEKVGERRHVYEGYTVELALYAVDRERDHDVAEGQHGENLPAGLHHLLIT